VKWLSGPTVSFATDLSDLQLVAQVVAHQSKPAFNELVLRYQSPLRNYLRQLSGNHATADDLAQETFVKTWQKAHTFSGKGSFKAWLFKVAYNQFLQAIRKTKRERLVDLNPEQAQIIEYQHATVPDENTPDLDKFLEVLNPNERLTMVLAYAHGMSHAEISEVSGLPVGTIKSHINRGKTKIQETFDLKEHTIHRQATGV
jgi:RNA polymerase sigma-70 factor (ECF subfamily)